MNAETFLESFSFFRIYKGETFRKGFAFCLFELQPRSIQIELSLSMQILIIFYIKLRDHGDPKL